MAKKSDPRVEVIEAAPVVQQAQPNPSLADYVSTTTTGPDGRRTTREGASAPSADARREQAGLQGRRDADYKIREWQRTRPTEHIDAESFREACVAAALERYDAEQARQAAAAERSREQRQQIEQRQQAERARVVASLAGRLTTEEAVSRLLDAVEVLQLARLRVPVGLLA